MKKTLKEVWPFLVSRIPELEVMCIRDSVMSRHQTHGDMDARVRRLTQIGSRRTHGPSLLAVHAEG
jgi:hypothetical protein